MGATEACVLGWAMSVGPSKVHVLDRAMPVGPSEVHVLDRAVSLYPSEAHVLGSPPTTILAPPGATPAAVGLGVSPSTTGSF